MNNPLIPLTEEQILKGIKNKKLFIFASVAKNPEWLKIKNGLYFFDSNFFPDTGPRFKNALFFYAFDHDEEILKNFVSSLVDPIIFSVENEKVKEAIHEVFESEEIPEEFLMRSKDTLFLGQVPQLFNYLMLSFKELSQAQDLVKPKPSAKQFKPSRKGIHRSHE